MFYESMQARLAKLRSSPSANWASLEPQIKSPFLSKRAAANSSRRFLELGAEGEISNLDHDPATRGGMDIQPAMAQAENITLHRKIDELTEKLDALTALFAAQQHFSSDSPDDVQL